MSLGLYLDKIEKLLLTDGKWYDVQPPTLGFDVCEPTSEMAPEDKEILKDRGLASFQAAYWLGADNEMYICRLSSIVGFRYKEK